MISPPPHQMVLTVEMIVVMTNPCALMVPPVTGAYMYIMIKLHTHKKKQANKQAKNSLHDMYSMQYMYYALVCLLEYEYQFFFVDCITHGLLP